MRRLSGRGRHGPGLLGTMARTAVVSGTASSVAGRVTARQQAAAEQQRDAGEARRQLQQREERERVEAQVAASVARHRPTASAASAAAGSGVDQLHTQLMKLGELRQAGLLTDEEFAAQKARLLAT
jgi:hypothetical protein